MENGVKTKVRLGKTGSGKTLDQNEIDVLPALLDGQEVWCCYWVNTTLKNYHYFAPRDFDAIKNLRNCVIIFDELRQSFDPRSWESETDEVRAFFELHRHRHNTIVGNTQDIALVCKTILVQAHIWILIERIEDGIVMKWLKKRLNIESVKIRKDYLTVQELKKMSYGWEMGEDVALNNTWERTNYKIKNIIHPELDDIKKEIVHRYCPRCEMRQGEMILKKDTEKVCYYDNETKEWKLKKEEFCPRHKEERLEVRLTGMFDTDYEPEVKEKQVIFKPFSKQEVFREFKGGLSVKQSEYKDFLEQKSQRKLI